MADIAVIHGGQGTIQTSAWALSPVEGCDQKRELPLAHRLNDEVLAEVPRRQRVFTIPKRPRDAILLLTFKGRKAYIYGEGRESR